MHILAHLAVSGWILTVSFGLMLALARNERNRLNKVIALLQAADLARRLGPVGPAPVTFIVRQQRAENRASKQEINRMLKEIEGAQQ